MARSGPANKATERPSTQRLKREVQPFCRGHRTCWSMASGRGTSLSAWVLHGRTRDRGLKPKRSKPGAEIARRVCKGGPIPGPVCSSLHTINCYLEIWPESILFNRFDTPNRPARWATWSPSRTTRSRPAMRSRYLALSPYNLVRMILGERRPDDSAADNPYTRAAACIWRSGSPAAFWRANRARHLPLLPGVHPARYGRAAGAQGLHRAGRGGGLLRRRGAPPRTDSRRPQEGPPGAAARTRTRTSASSSCCIRTARARSTRCWTRPRDPRRWPKSPTNTAPCIACGRSPTAAPIQQLMAR